MMESMHYINIFETKGLEYLLVISFLIGFVFFVRRLGYSSKDRGIALDTPSTTRVASPTTLCTAPFEFECQYKEPTTTQDGDDVEREPRTA